MGKKSTQSLHKHRQLEVMEAFCAVSCLFYQGDTFSPSIAWSWMDKRNSRGTCWCSALPFSINITLLNREIIAEAFKEQRHGLATSSADKTASLEPFRFALSPLFTQGYRSFKWNCMKMPAKQPCLSLLKFGQRSHCSSAQVSALSIWGSVKILLDIKKSSPSVLQKWHEINPSFLL